MKKEVNETDNNGFPRMQESFISTEANINNVSVAEGGNTQLTKDSGQSSKFDNNSKGIAILKTDFDVNPKLSINKAHSKNSESKTRSFNKEDEKVSGSHINYSEMSGKEAESSNIMAKADAKLSAGNNTKRNDFLSLPALLYNPHLACNY